MLKSSPPLISLGKDVVQLVHDCLSVSVSQCEGGGAEGGPGDTGVLQGGAEDDRIWVSWQHHPGIKGQYLW